MPDHSAVTVIGLGPMGRALAGAFVNAGLRTTVWNRTPGRDTELVERGAIRARSPEEAVAASDLTVVCVLDYDASDAVLRRDAVAAALKGRTVVNLTADTPGRARDTASWAGDHGIRYLDGAIMSPTDTIRTPDAVFIYSGPERLYRDHLPALEALGGTHSHLGEDIGRAAAYDVALLDIYWTSMSGYAHALAVAKAEGITARELLPFAQGIAAILPPSFEATADEVDQDDITGEGSPIGSTAATMAHIVHTSEGHGIDATLMRAAEGLVRRTIATTDENDGFMRVTELLGRTTTTR
ncbi:NAD(P)-binding domain-containing protein [Actinomadura sp. 7K507]|uniref:NAD(P)-dependent oxidoreductase n=1 Tax=Actinomadura sp. 7K507 TaxID=2530365 RepID=UPI00104DE08A|nr:NAD(P)-binding domain-containing protein [Actinomadura sp. 7K507]TDC86031.1 NAD(P)-dependent oxidoreductase [Actinomadura sp. 7K507]